MKQCTKCKNILSKTDFYKHKTGKDGLQAWCKECVNEYYAKPYCAKPEVKQKNREKAKRYRAKSESQQKIKEYEKKYGNRPEVKQKYANHERRRRLRKKQLYEDFTLEDWLQKVESTKGICPICGGFYSEIHPFCATLDHTLPISKVPIGFKYTINDVNPMCGSCNSSKGASF